MFDDEKIKLLNLSDEDVQCHKSLLYNPNSQCFEEEQEIEQEQDEEEEHEEEEKQFELEPSDGK